MFVFSHITNTSKMYESSCNEFEKKPSSIKHSSLMTNETKGRGRSILTWQLSGQDMLQRIFAINLNGHTPTAKGGSTLCSGSSNEPLDFKYIGQTRLRGSFVIRTCTLTLFSSGSIHRLEGNGEVFRRVLRFPL